MASRDDRKSTGPVSFLVRLGDGKIIRRHQDHIRARRNFLDRDTESGREEEVEVAGPTTSEEIAVEPVEITPQPEMASESTGAGLNPESSPPTQPTLPVPTTTERAQTPARQTTKKNYPNRARKKPDYLHDQM